MNTPLFLALADTLIVNTEGRTKTFDDLIDEANNVETVLRFNNKGTFASSHIIDVTPDLESEGVKVIHITLFSGEAFTLLAGTRVLASDNNWVNINEKEIGDGLKTLTYNPSVRHPQLTPKVISSVTEETLAFAPVVSFLIAQSDNFLLSLGERADGVSVLVPICPKEFVK